MINRQTGYRRQAEKGEAHSISLLVRMNERQYSSRRL